MFYSSLPFEELTLFKKITFREQSEIMFDQIFGHYGLAQVTRKSNVGSKHSTDVRSLGTDSKKETLSPPVSYFCHLIGKKIKTHREHASSIRNLD